MVRHLLSLHADAGIADGVRLPAFTFEGPVPGDGWATPERAGDRWFSWTGPACESSMSWLRRAGRPSRCGSSCCTQSNLSCCPGSTFA